VTRSGSSGAYVGATLYFIPDVDRKGAYRDRNPRNYTVKSAGKEIKSYMTPCVLI